MICSIFRGCHPHPKESRITNRKWKWALGITLAAGLVLLAWAGLRHRGFDWGVFRATLAGLEWGWLAAGFALVLASYAGRALRWAVLIRPLRPNASLWGLISATAVGFTALTILGRAGEFVRPYLISLKERVPLSSQLAALLLERIYDLLMALVLFGFALSRIRHSEVHAGPALSWVLAVGGWVAAAVGVVCLVLLVAMGQFSGVMRARVLGALRILPARYYRRFEETADSFVQGVASTGDRRSLLELTAYTVLEWAILAASIGCILRAFGGAVPFGLVDVLIFMGFLAFGAVIQIPGVGGGVQVVTILVLTELFRVPLEVATSVAMLLWVSNFVVIVPVGSLLALHEGLNWKKLREWKREVAE
jgi:glycosyltransferase 2 family protein